MALPRHTRHFGAVVHVLFGFVQTVKVGNSGVTIILSYVPRRRLINVGVRAEMHAYPN